MDGEIELARLASRQHGVVSIAQAGELGIEWKDRQRLVESGRWVQLTDRVLGSMAAAPSRGRPLAVAVLHEGSDATVSHLAAAGWWRVPGFSLTPASIVTTARHVGGPMPWLRHVVRSLPDRWRTVLDGIPIVRPELLLMQLCATVHPDRAARALDNAWRMRLVSGRSLTCFLADHAARGRNGIALLRRLVDERGPDYRPPESGLESRVVQILREGGLRFRRQVDLGDEDQWIGRCDFVAESAPVVLEVQSELYHSALLDVARDEARRARLEAAGFTVVEVTDVEVWTRPTVVVSRVRKALRRTAAVI
jgi:very-short-patch-repair endonuclease